MNLEKSLKPHEEVLKKINDRSRLVEAYLITIKQRGRQFIDQTLDELEQKVGDPYKLKEYLKTKEGSEEYAKIGAEKIQNYVMNDFKLDKSKFDESELEQITKIMYQFNQKLLSQFVMINKGEVDFSKYKEKFLEDHLKLVETHAGHNYVMDYDHEHTPDLINHFSKGKFDELFMKDVRDQFKKDEFKPHIWDAYKTWNNGANPLGVDYFKESEEWSLYLKNEHLKDEHEFEYNDTYKDAA